MRRAVLSFALAAAVVATAADSEAAAPWVDRGMTLDRHVFAGDVGIGVAHAYVPAPAPDITGAGMNLEGAFGITEKVELGLRTGVRFGQDGRATQADTYGRTLWTETYGTRNGDVANPEARVRWCFYRGDVAEIGLDWRLYLPIEPNSRIGGMFGVPFAFHIGDFMRIDLGVYIPTLFYDPAIVLVTVPAYFWFQVSEKVWLGPMTSLRHRLTQRPATDFLLGFGLGVQVASAVDLKTWILFPDITANEGARNFGAGFGVQFRIE